jgi:hypothetical protein
VAVADAVGAIVPDQRDAFLDAWRAHIGDFVSYAVAAESGNADAKAKAVADLAAYTQSQGAFFERITGGALPARQLRPRSTSTSPRWRRPLMRWRPAMSPRSTC